MKQFLFVFLIFLQTHSCNKVIPSLQRQKKLIPALQKQCLEQSEQFKKSIFKKITTFFEQNEIKTEDQMKEPATQEAFLKRFKVTFQEVNQQIISPSQIPTCLSKATLKAPFVIYAMDNSTELSNSYGSSTFAGIIGINKELLVTALISPSKKFCKYATFEDYCQFSFLREQARINKDHCLEQEALGLLGHNNPSFEKLKLQLQNIQAFEADTIALFQMNNPAAIATALFFNELKKEKTTHPFRTSFLWQTMLKDLGVENELDYYAQH